MRATDNSYAYENTSNLLASVEGPVHAVAYAYEPNRNLMTVIDNKVSGTSVSRFTYRYDGIGRRTDRVDEGTAFAQDALFDWDYDSKSQVTSADRYLGTDPDNPGSPVAAEAAEFAYDDIGNRLTSTFGTASQRTYTANALNQYTTLTNPPLTTSPTHDADGNMTYNGAGWWFEWNGENRMVEARDFADPLNPPSNATRLSFTYDYQGRRVAKKVEQWNSGFWLLTSEYRYVYDGWNLIATFDVQSSPLSLQTSYLWGLDLSGSMQGAGGVGGLLSVTRNDEPGPPTFYPTYAANGNVSEYLDATGSFTAHYEYSPFGRVITSTGSANNFAFRFSTKYQDTETGLLYYGYRYYDPETGRWLSRDPIGEQGGLNLYGFVGNEPVGRWDLLGLYKLIFERPAFTRDGGETGFDLDGLIVVINTRAWEPSEEYMVRRGQSRASAASNLAIGELKSLLEEIPKKYVNNQARADYLKLIDETIGGLEEIKGGLLGGKKLRVNRLQEGFDPPYGLWDGDSFITRGVIFGKGLREIYLGSDAFDSDSSMVATLVDEVSHLELGTVAGSVDDVRKWHKWDRWYSDDIVSRSFNNHTDLKRFIDTNVFNAIKSNFSKGLREDELCRIEE